MLSLSLRCSGGGDLPSSFFLREDFRQARGAVRPRQIGLRPRARDARPAAVAGARAAAEAGGKDADARVAVAGKVPWPLAAVADHCWFFEWWSRFLLYILMDRERRRIEREKTRENQRLEERRKGKRKRERKEEEEEEEETFTVGALEANVAQLPAQVARLRGWAQRALPRDVPAAAAPPAAPAPGVRGLEGGLQEGLPGPVVADARLFSSAAAFPRAASSSGKSIAAAAEIAGRAQEAPDGVAARARGAVGDDDDARRLRELRRRRR